jgi:hypothetical protein
MKMSDEKKVRITSCVGDCSWYANSIGKIFEVTETKTEYIITEDYENSAIAWRHIEKHDCCVVVEI